ncbi:RadC family protein [Chondromyces apiculatus]|uniref:DNA repair protein RadC n=1 Tax=Chondromyces apiculatus DSM 436 TaxID=1192034 RepID=A0A017SZ13_9BACT|nr:DNA repair protein RadC [Chondromyces apiculatus]EYF02002.1 DNA repair protein RadC [Chondromyces apiculatus DSM 436]
MPVCSVTSLSDIALPSGPRERALEEGLGALGDADLLAIVLGTGLPGRPVTMLSASILHHFAGLDGISRLGPHAIAEHPGLGLAKALRISASIELGRRIHERAIRPRPPVRTSAAIAAWCIAHLGPLEHEEVWVIALDGRNGMRGARCVAQGGLHGCSVAARDILRAALADAAAAMVLVHNHPSGDPNPSPEDVDMTRAVAAAGILVGVPLVDHVILAPDGHYASLLDLGVIGEGTL